MKAKDLIITNSGGGNERWTEESEENFEHDLHVAENIGLYYDEQREFIDHVVKKAKEIDWTKTGKSQKQGVIDALKSI